MSQTSAWCGPDFPDLARAAKIHVKMEKI